MAVGIAALPRSRDLAGWPYRGAAMLKLTAIAIVLAATASLVPEPASWAVLIIGFGLVGGELRRRRHRPAMAMPAWAHRGRHN